MEFPDIDPTQFLDQLNWDAQDNGDNSQDDDDDCRRQSSLDNGSEFSCDLNVKSEQNDDGRGRYPWDVLMGPLDDGTRPTGETSEQKVHGGREKADLDQNQQQDSTIRVFPSMASYESTMASSAQSSQQAQPHLLTHPQAMTSLSRCPMFPLPGSSSNVSGSGSSNVNAAIDGKKSGSSNLSPNEHTKTLASSSMHQVSVGNAASSQTGHSSQTSGQSNNDPSPSRASNNLLNAHYTSLPSWNDSMDLMYSPLFNIAVPNATVNTNHEGVSFNPFQCTPLNSAFGTNYQQTSMMNHHYGMAINGFHPQVNAIVNPVLPLNNTIPAQSSVPARAGTTSPGTVKTSNAGKSMSDNTTSLSASQQKKQQAPTVGKNQQKPAKQKDKKAANERNEREQLRAKKITELIHEIRSNMEAEGWKEEMKSKYETLSQCKAYMEYLKRTHKEKEINIEHTKKLIEEKALLEGRSDPESIHGSVTSSLTASSRRSTSPEENSSDKESSSSCENYQQSRKKRKTISYAEGIKAPTSSEGSNKKSRSLRGKRKEPSSSESSSEEDAGNEGPGGKNILFDKTSSSVSDMTDSNRSSMNGVSVNKKKHSQAQVNSEIGAASTATSSISSTAAVVRGSSHKSPQSHRSNRSETKNTTVDVHGENQKKQYKKKRRSFDYNYKEVFLKSNIPQLIVTLSGRVVVWNDFFLLTTGLSKREAKSLSIFSIVDSSELTELYKFVAKALADNKLSVPPSAAVLSNQADAVEGPNPVSKDANAKSSDAESWQAITLKCVRFASKSNKDEATHPHPLYITVALMSDEDRDKRCFHCIITDCPGTKGALGSVTPELLSLLFAPGGKGKVEEETS